MIEPNQLSARVKMKLIELSGLVVVSFLLTCGLGYWTRLSHAQNVPRVIVAIDSADTRQPSGKEECEPYFTKRNPIPDKVR